MGAYLMASAGQPTMRTRHIEIKKFVILSWVEQDLINVSNIKTTLNTSDYLTKNAPRLIFHRHNDINMGKIRPHYLSKILKCFRFPVSPSQYVHDESTSNAQNLLSPVEH